MTLPYGINWDGKVYGSDSEKWMFTVDVSNPFTSNHNPSKNASGVPINTNIVVHIKDNLSGVKKSSIIMKVNDGTVNPSITGSPFDYTVTYDPPNDFGYQATINIYIIAEDSVGNKMTSESYSFMTQSASNSAPDAPTLILPAENSFLKNPIPVLTWKSPIDLNGDQLHFKIELDTTYSWDKIYHSIESKVNSAGFAPVLPANQGTDTVSYNFQSSLAERDWWWRVAAWDGEYYSSFSNDRKFTIDITSPFTSGHNPTKDETDVAVNAKIILHIQDKTSGVKQSSIVMKVNDNAVSPFITGSSLDYALTYVPETGFACAETVNVSIDAEDLAGNVMVTDTYSFVTIRDQIAPQIMHSPVASANSGSSINIAAFMMDNVGIQEAVLFFRQGGEAEFQSTMMSNSGNNNYTATIPANVITARGVEYYISATDFSSNKATFPIADANSHPQVVRVYSPNLIRDQLTPSMVYRMISVPIDLDNPSPKNVLEDELGAYDDRQWRLLRYKNGDCKEYTIVDDFDNFDPGYGFWLITRETKTLAVGAGYSVGTGENYKIILQPGWNQIGNPFAFPVEWANVIRDIRVENSLVGFEGDLNDTTGYKYLCSRLEPWEGYFVKNLDSTTTTVIEIPPIAAQGSLAKRVVNALEDMEFQENEWSIQIIASCGLYIDFDNYLGCLYDASDNWDQCDFSEAPFFDKFVSLYFQHEDWQKYPGLYTGDFRSVSSEGQYWDFCIKTNIANSELILKLANMQNLSNDLNIVLLDKASQVSMNFKEKMTYKFPSYTNETIREFRIIVGKEQFIEANDLNLEGLPEDYSLAQNYPNPFNMETQINYALPYLDRVKIVVYNLLGQQIRALIDERQSAGRYSISWDGRDTNNLLLTSGVYFLRMEAGKFVGMKKMVLAR